VRVTRKAATRRRAAAGGLFTRFSRGLARSARRAAEADRCLVADVLLVWANGNLRMAGATSRRPHAALRVLGATRELASATQASYECHRRAAASRAAGASA
jgi:hypothetical protein